MKQSDTIKTGEEVREAFARNMLRFRILSGKTRQDFAKSCGISADSLRFFESGNANPKISTLEKIAANIGCDIMDLLTLE